jgi:hypothetical protein
VEDEDGSTTNLRGIKYWILRGIGWIPSTRQTQLIPFFH